MGKTSTDRTPRVSVGVPVFNGENYLEETLVSISEQSFEDYELIISDNCSTDGTEAICRSHAARDRRIRYVRQAENLGAAPNHNAVLHVARAPLFKWQAHDDLLDRDFLAKSVAALDGAPWAVACITGARRIDDTGREITRWLSPLFGTESPRPAERFGAILGRFYCHWTEIFGLMRRDALTATMMHRAFRGSDIAVLAELALIGPFVRLDEYLFIHRDHANRYYRTADQDPDAVTAWYDPKHRSGTWHKWALYGSHLAAIERQPHSRVERLRCYGQVARSMGMWVNLKGLARDVGWAIDPRLVSFERRISRGLFGKPKLPAGFTGDTSVEAPMPAMSQASERAGGAP